MCASPLADTRGSVPSPGSRPGMRCMDSGRVRSYFRNRTARSPTPSDRSDSIYNCFYMKATALAALLCVGIGSLRIVSTYRIFNHTIDEPDHLAAGMEWLSTGKYRYEDQHPPLARIMGALGRWISSGYGSTRSDACRSSSVRRAERSRRAGPRGGGARPGNPWIGDPPHETPGWYSVYDVDASTLAIIAAHAKKMAER